MIYKVIFIFLEIGSVAPLCPLLCLGRNLKFFAQSCFLLLFCNVVVQSLVTV